VSSIPWWSSANNIRGSAIFSRPSGGTAFQAHSAERPSSVVARDGPYQNLHSPSNRQWNQRNTNSYPRSIMGNRSNMVEIHQAWWFFP
jgi:hypothetical protein